MRKNQQNHKKQTHIFRKKRKRIETLFSQLCDPRLKYKIIMRKLLKVLRQGLAQN